MSKGKIGGKPPRLVKDHFLYIYNGCPFCMRVRLAMTNLGLNMEIRNIHADPKHLRALVIGGGRRMVPCLRIEKNGQTLWLYESAEIINYLKSK